MNREIKFRIVSNGTVYGKYDIADLCCTESWIEDWGGDFTRIQFNQYTGLKDKNGVEIYEGDIVKFYWGEYDSPDTLFGILTEPPREAGYDHENATEMVDIVEFHQGAFMSMCPTTGGGAYLKRNNEKCEVIGNIYENPELLES